MRSLFNKTWIMILGYMTLIVLVCLVIKAIFKFIFGLIQAMGIFFPLVLFLLILIIREITKTENTEAK